MASILRQKKASMEVALRRNRETTYTEPLMKKGEKKDPQEMAELKAYLSDFYRSIYKRSGECQAILKEHPNSVAVYFANLVPGKMSYEDFWQRYFFRCDESRLISEWDQAAEKARKARAARAEEIQHSLKKSLRNIQETLEVAASGLTAETSPEGSSARSVPAPTPHEAFLPPILGPDAPDTKPTESAMESTRNPISDGKLDTNVNDKKAKSEPAVATAETITPVKPLSNESGKKTPAPKTAAGEATQEAKVEASDLVSPPRVARSSDPQSLDDMISAANEVDRRTPRSKQVRVSPRVEPRVISFWKAPESPAAPPPSTPELVVPKDLKRTGSSVTDRIQNTPKKRKKYGLSDRNDASEIPAPSDNETRSISGQATDSGTPGERFSNTSVMLIILPVLLALLSALLVNTDLACAPLQPGMELSDQDIYSEAPWWAPNSMKADAFSLVCSSRVRTTLEWTAAGGRGGSAFRLVLKEAGKADSQPLVDQRNVRKATVSPTTLSYVNRKGINERITAPWTLSN